MHQLANGLASRGHHVTVVTGFPDHSRGNVPPEYGGRLLAVEQMGQLRVIRGFSYPLRKKTFLRRTANFLSFSLSTLLAGMGSGRADVVYVYSPPLPFAATAALVADAKSAPFVMNVQDIFPDAAVNVGYIRRGGIVERTLSRMERFAYDRSEAIAVICESFAENIAEKLGSSDKVSVIPNWIDTDRIRPLDRKNSFSKRQGLDAKFVVLYAGTIGLTSGAAYLLDCAERLKEKEDIHFLFVGDGVVKASMEQEAAKRKLANTTFLPFQPEEMLPEVLGVGDVCLVTLGLEAGKSSMPLKTQAIMSAGRPLLAAVDAAGDVARLVEEAGSGLVCESQNVSQLCEAVVNMKNNRDMTAHMAEAGRRYAVEHFGIRNAITKYERLFFHVQSHRSIRSL
jgi:colanic acid biosynthesis glycosyl transferase WcaI